MSQTTTAIVDSRRKTTMWYLSYVELETSTSKQIAVFQRFVLMCFFYFTTYFYQFSKGLNHPYHRINIAFNKRFWRYKHILFKAHLMGFSSG
ncbi:MAG: hypothetical protein MUF58_01120 [Arcicella sp.]|nr:hypothetical protein [Arcicella sp.]